MSKSTKPYSIGRIVMYVPTPDSPESHNGADVVPAVIVRTWENAGYQNDEVNLKVFHDGPLDTWRTSVPYSETKEPGTWHWPEIVKETTHQTDAEGNKTEAKSEDAEGGNGGNHPGKPGNP